MKRLLSYDGPVATTALRIAWFFGVSAMVVLCSLPYLAFQALIGWQPSHLALLLGTASLVSLGPAFIAAIVAMIRFADDDGYPGRLFGTFWGAYASAIRRLAWWWAAVFVVSVALAYDLALFAASDPVFVLAVVAVLLLVLITLALAMSRPTSDRPRAIAVLTGAIWSILRHPLVTLTRAFVLLLAVLMILIPVVGPSLAFVAPALAAWAIVVVDRTIGQPRAARA